jgi:hypothetical protein
LVLLRTVTLDELPAAEKRALAAALLAEDLAPSPRA